MDILIQTLRCSGCDRSFKTIASEGRRTHCKCGVGIRFVSGQWKWLYNKIEDRKIRINGRRNDRNWDGWYTVTAGVETCGAVRKSINGKWECWPAQSVVFDTRKKAAEYVVQMFDLRDGIVQVKA